MSKKVEKVGGGGERTAKKPTLTDEEKQALESARIVRADVERAKRLISDSARVHREMCLNCKRQPECNKELFGGSNIVCRVTSVVSVAFGMLEEGRKANLETTWELLHGQMAALEAEQEGGAK